MFIEGCSNPPGIFVGDVEDLWRSSLFFGEFRWISRDLYIGMYIDDVEDVEGFMIYIEDVFGGFRSVMSAGVDFPRFGEEMCGKWTWEVRVDLWR